MADSDAVRAKRYRNNKRGGPPRQRAPCGTRKGADAHRYRGETVCDECRVAERVQVAERQRERRKRLKNT